MIENKVKGWFGAYSSAGKSSAEKYPEIVYKDDIIEDKPRTLRIFKGEGLFSALSMDKTGHCNLDDLEDDIDIFKCQEKDNKNNPDTPSKANNAVSSLKYNYSESNILLERRKCFSAIPEERMKYHNKNKQNGSKATKQNYPDCTKYNPKFDLVKPNLIIGPSWNKSQGHNFSIKKDNSRYYLNHEDLTTQAKKVLINLNMFSQRGNSLTTSNIRCPTTKAFKFSSYNDKSTKTQSRLISTTETVQKEKKLKQKQSLKYKSSSTDAKRVITTTNNNHFLNTSLSSSDSDSYDQFQQIYQKQFKRKKLLSQSTKMKIRIKKNKKIKAPDFRKNITREMLFQREDKKKEVIPFLLPNYNQTRERQIMMIVYDRTKHAKYKPNQIDAITNLNYDPNKVLDKVNNHIASQPPNFDLIQPRANDNSPLPSYMKKIHTKSTSFVTTADSLRMNNYSNGKFTTDRSSFWPKKSYNKYVNLNLLNSGKFLDNGHKRSFRTECNTNPNVNLNSNTNGNNEYNCIKKSMKYYKNNFDELMKECMLSKFDNVTYKTTRRENKLDSKDVQKYIDQYYPNRKKDLEINNINDDGDYCL